MATQSEIIEAVRSAPGAVTPTEIGEILHEKVASFGTQLERIVKEKKLIKKNEDGTYELTEEGKAKVEELTMESAKLTPSQQFKNIGIKIGIKPEYAELISDYVFNVADYQNLEQVWNALRQMKGSIKIDQLNMWFHSWAGMLNIPVPSELEQKLTAGVAAVETKAAEEKKDEVKQSGAKEDKDNLVEYVLDGDNNLMCVGPQDGTMTRAEALRLAGLRAVGAKAKASGEGNQSNIKDLTDAVKTIFELANNNGGKKGSRTFVTHPDENGQMVVEEIAEEGKPVVVQQPSSPPPPDTLVVHPDGTTQSVPSNQPIIITPRAQKEVGSGEKQKIMIYDPTSGQLKAWDGESPIVLRPPENNRSVLADTDGKIPATLNGQPFPITLDGFFKLQEHQQKMEQDAENHKEHVNLVKDLRELAHKGARALSHMGGGEVEEEAK